MEPEKDKPSCQDSLKSFSSKFSTMEPESYLESLGLTINNGKARFRLNEDAPLYTSQTVSHFTGTEEEDDTLSFVVLGKDSMEAIQQSSLASYAKIHEKCMSIDYNSIISILYTTEINQKLSMLLQENTKLKEALKQNSVAMKQQFNILAKWQEDIMQVHQNHKKKFSETKELINYLKKENQELKLKITMDLEHKSTDVDEEEDNEKDEKELISAKLTNSSSSDLEAMLNEAITTENNDEISERSSTSNNTQGQSLTMTEIPEQASINDVLSEQLLTSNEGLKQSLPFNEIQEQPSTSIGSEIQIPIQATFREILKGLNVNSTGTVKKDEKLEIRSIDGKDLMEGVSSDLDKMREVIEEEKRQLETRKQNLQVEYEYLHSAKELLEQQRVSLEQKQSSLDQQMNDEKKFSDKCNEMVKEIKVLHETIERKEACIKRLEDELLVQKEVIGLLETQVKVNEEDFKQEKMLKEQLLLERTMLNETLQTQIKFNEKLYARLQQVLPEEEQNAEDLEPPLISVYMCPICSSYFRNIETLECHVSECLGVD